MISPSKLLTAFCALRALRVASIMCKDEKQGLDALKRLLFCHKINERSHLSFSLYYWGEGKDFPLKNLERGIFSVTHRQKNIRTICRFPL